MSAPAPTGGPAAARGHAVTKTARHRHIVDLVLRTPVRSRNGPREGSKKVEIETLMSLTNPAGSAVGIRAAIPSNPRADKSKIALLPVRWAIWSTDCVISCGRHTKLMLVTRGFDTILEVICKLICSPT